MNRVLALICALAVASPATGANPQIELVPAGKWRVDYADDGCVLTRPYSAAGETHKLAITFEPIHSKLWVRLHSPDKVRGRDHGDTKVAVDGVPLKDAIHFNVYRDAKGGTIREYLFKEFRRDVGGAQRMLTLDTGKYGNLSVAFDGFPAAMKSIESCMDDLHRSMGVDPAILRSVVIPPEGFAGKFIELPDFRDEFTYQMIYWVTPAGTVDECHLLAPTGKANFDKNACEQLKRKGRFMPARNAVGEAIRAPVYDNPNIITTIVRAN